jgi:ATP adenylyltransferase
MKKIWAPWRSKFIYLRKREGCIFCKARDAKNTKKHFVLKKSRFSFAMLNIYPYNNAHLMVAPKRHTRSLELLEEKELLDLMMLVNEMTRLLERCLKPDGYNIGINIGKVAGAGYPGHVHVHIVPRWQGDTNFMPVLADTKVMSESLDGLYKRLSKTKL